MSSLPGKTVASTAVENHVYKVFPNDLNSNGTVFGGRVTSTLDRISLIVAERHSEHICVTVSIDALHFLAPAKMGDILIYSAAINRAWMTSMEVGVRVDAENFRTREKKHIVSAYFTFVALDENNKPVAVPPVITETPLQQRRYEDAGRRRANRLAEMKVHQERKG
jgi:acyl-CoA hydrolase